MNKSIFRFIWEFSKLQQIAVLCLTLASFPFLYFSLELPKQIINNAIGGKNFPMEIFGFRFEQLEFLFALCALLLTLILFNGAFKMYINIFKGLIAERLLRRLRYQLYERILRFPMPRFQRTSQGELVSMTTAEVESIGGFFGDAIALPAFQGGTMLTILIFMFVQDPVFGVASVILIPVQGWLIPKLQRQINALNKERVKEVRQLSSHISETVSGIQDVHTHDTSAFNLAKFSFRLGEIFKIRLSIYKKKFFMKFLNNFIGQLTPLMFYSFGGLLVIKGDITLGALVAALAAYKDLTAPWRELLKYYQDMANSKVKYEQVVEQFESIDLIEQNVLQDRPEKIPSFKDPIYFKSLTFIDEDGERSLSGISLDIKPGSRIAFIANGKTCDELAFALVRLLRPTAGSVCIGDLNISSMPESMIGARIGYVGPDSYIFSGTAADNVLFGLKHIPPKEDDISPARKEAYEEALASGNSPANVDADWIDYNTAGFKDNAELNAWWLKIMQALEIEGDLYARGLNMGLDPKANPELAEGILKAHELIAKRLHEDAELAGLVHPFDFNTYNVNASVGSNFIYGEPVGSEFSFESLGTNNYVRQILSECELEKKFIEIGYKVATTMVKLFKDLSPDHPLFDEFSFLDEETLQRLRHLIARVEKSGLGVLDEEEESNLISLTFRLIVDRHRLGFIDEDLQQDIVRARHLFREKLPEDKKGSVAFFDQGNFNDMLSIRCNLIMGRLNLARPRAEERVNQLTREVLDELGLRNTITLLATNADVGIGGRRMSHAFRQKLALARSLIKRPDILIVNRSLSAIDQASRQRLRLNIRELLPETTMIWLDSEKLPAEEFDNIYVIDKGRIAETITGENTVTEDQTDDNEDTDETSEPTVLDLESQILAKIPLFAGMSKSNLKLLAFASQRLSFSAGEEIFTQGEAAYAAYAVIEGEMEVIRKNDGIETVVYKAGPNEVVGEMAMMNNRPRSATVRTLTDVSVLRIKKEVFLNLVEHDPQLSANIAHMMSERLDATLQNVDAAA